MPTDEPTRRTPTFTPHLRVIARGALGPQGGAWEEFSYSIAMGTTGAALEVTEDYLADLAADVRAFHARPDTNIAADARLTEIKVAHIGVDGKWVGYAPLYRWTGNVAGGRGPAGLFMANAPQVALACSLRTAAPGPRGRGRFFLPLPAVSANSVDGLIPAATANAVAGSLKTLVQNLNERPGLSTNAMRTCVASTFGGIYPVTEVRVGRVLDTVRSRRADLQESYAVQGI